MAAEACSVRVAVRVRPLGAKELAEGARTAVLAVPEERVVSLGSGANEKAMIFDHVFGPDASSAALYDAAIAPLLAKALAGFNVTVFAYGQTG
jgi:hypothetical protein